MLRSLRERRSSHIVSTAAKATTATIQDPESTEKAAIKRLVRSYYTALAFPFPAYTIQVLDTLFIPDASIASIKQYKAGYKTKDTQSLPEFLGTVTHALHFQARARAKARYRREFINDDSDSFDSDFGLGPDPDSDNEGKRDSEYSEDELLPCALFADLDNAKIEIVEATTQTNDAGGAVGTGNTAARVRVPIRVVSQEDGVVLAESVDLFSCIITESDGEAGFVEASFEQMMMGDERDDWEFMEKGDKTWKIAALARAPRVMHGKR